MLIYLDTNIILDYIDVRRRIHFPDSARIFALSEKEEYTLCASTLTFSNIAYILRKLDYPCLMQIFTDLMEVMDILPTNDAVLRTAIESSFTDFEDAMQFYTACHGGAEVVITRNVKDFPDSAIPVMTPIDFLESRGLR